MSFAWLTVYATRVLVAHTLWARALHCSLRSVGDFDVSAMAKEFGGGGHKNAAGCRMSMLTLRGLIA